MQTKKQLPLGAIHAQNQCRSNPELWSLMKSCMKEFSQIQDSLLLIELVNQKVDELQAKAPLDGVTCHKGCHHCCFHLIQVTRPEMENLKTVSLTKTQKDQFSLQKDHLNSGGQWEELTYDHRACPFLDLQGGCTIYEKRPLVCRMTFVESPAENCIFDADKVVGPLFHEKANTVILAYLMTQIEVVPMSTLIL